MATEYTQHKRARGEARELMRARITAALEDGPKSGMELRTELQVERDAETDKFFQNCLTALRMAGKIKRGLDQRWTLADGTPAPPVAVRPVAGTPPPAAPRETAPAPSRIGGPRRGKPHTENGSAAPAAATNGAAKPEERPAEADLPPDAAQDALDEPPAAASETELEAAEPPTLVRLDLDVPRFLDGYDANPVERRRQAHQVRARLLIQASDLRIRAVELLDMDEEHPAT